ncbi:MAG: hypothetical protein NC343_07250 [Muribaculum sp.]|nr:hypothetical protein [Muribaculaceae bacterium]MCM1081530.1 hypothetical protein [Muribaculum sp.]
MNFDNQPDHYTVPEDYKGSEDETKRWEQQQEKKDGNDKPRRHRARNILIGTLIILLLVLGTAFWLRYFNPYVVDAKEQGYIVNVERRGHLFKTWEGEMVLKNALMNNENIYSRNFSFSVDDPQLAQSLQALQGTGRVVEVRYKSYSGILPWRGSSPNVITKIVAVEQPEAVTAPTSPAPTTETQVSKPMATAQSADSATITVDSKAAQK